MSVTGDYLCLLLPFPPSVNGLFAGKARRYRSPQYREWAIAAHAALTGQDTWLFKGPVKLTIGLGRPDKRKRDCSNYIKAPEDFLVSPAKILIDDSQVMDVRAYWATDVKNGCRVEIEAL